MTSEISCANKMLTLTQTLFKFCSISLNLCHQKKNQKKNTALKSWLSQDFKNTFYFCVLCKFSSFLPHLCIAQ